MHRSIRLRWLAGTAAMAPSHSVTVTFGTADADWGKAEHPRTIARHRAPVAGSVQLVRKAALAHCATTANWQMSRLPLFATRQSTTLAATAGARVCLTSS